MESVYSGLFLTTIDLSLPLCHFSANAARSFSWWAFAAASLDSAPWFNAFQPNQPTVCSTRTAIPIRKAGPYLKEDPRTPFLGVSIPKTTFNWRRAENQLIAREKVREEKLSKAFLYISRAAGLTIDGISSNLIFSEF